jgi:hypothetical protein
VLFVPAADWLARHDVASAKGPLLQAARDAARGRLLTLGAGLFAAAALLFTARNFTLAREGQVTDRYTKAVEQLGSDKLDVRIGGIYASAPSRAGPGARPPRAGRRWLLLPCAARSLAREFTSGPGMLPSGSGPPGARVLAAGVRLS